MFIDNRKIEICNITMYQAHLGDLGGLARNDAMIDGKDFEPTKVGILKVIDFI